MVVSDSDKSSPVVHEKDDGKLKRKQDRDEEDEHKPKKIKQTEKQKDKPAERSNKKTGIMNKMGGAYIPPARLRMMQAQMTDKSSEQYQRMSWEALKKSINGLVNKVNISNIKEIVKELFSENIVRGRGLLARSIIQAQNASPTFTRVYAALVAVINTRFPQNGELVLRRLVITFRKSFKRNKKDLCLHSGQFIAHLVNQQVAHEIIALQILALMLETPSNDSVEVAVGFLKECGLKLSEVSPRGLAAVFERLRTVLHGEELDKRVQYMIEVMFAIRKDGFKEHPSVTEDLDLVEESDQFTHMLTLEDDGNDESKLNVFHVDPEFTQNEENYNQIKKEILDSSSDDGSGSSGSDSDSSSDGEEDDEDEKKTEIEDKTETNLVALRRTVYLAIQSSLDFEECAHKLLKMEFAEKDYKEICAMIIDCCSQQRTYEKFFGLLGGRFCILKKEFMEHFETLFAEHYNAIHRLETNKLRNTAKFFAHLLHSDSLPWTVLSNIHLSEDTTTSSSRIFIKILFQELVEYCGLLKLNQRLKDETLAPFFEGLFPRNNPKDTRFAINFFTSIGLGGLTDELREHLKSQAHKLLMMQDAEHAAAAASSSDSSDSSSSSEEEKKKKKRKKNKKEKKKSSKKKKKRSKKSSSSEDSSSEDEKVTKKKKEKGSLKSRLLEMSNTVDKMKIKQEPNSDDERDEDRRKSKKKSDSKREKVRVKRESSSDEKNLRRQRQPEKHAKSRHDSSESEEDRRRPRNSDKRRNATPENSDDHRSKKISEKPQRTKHADSGDDRRGPRKSDKRRDDTPESSDDDYRSKKRSEKPQRTKHADNGDDRRGPRKSDKRRDDTPESSDDDVDYRSKKSSEKPQRTKHADSGDDRKKRKEKNRSEKYQDRSDDERDVQSRRRRDEIVKHRSDSEEEDYRRSKMKHEERGDERSGRSRKHQEDYHDRKFADEERYERNRERHRRRSRSRG